MAEHRIRLRLAWQGWSRDVGGTWVPGGRVDLPVDWSGVPNPPERLVRWFQAPKLPDASEVVYVRMERVPGLSRIRIDNQEWEPTPDDSGVIEVELLDPLPPRIQLGLDLSVAAIRTLGPAARRNWGDVCLRITSVPGDERKA